MPSFNKLKTYLLITSLVVNVIVFAAFLILSQRFGGINYILLKMERVPDGVEFEDRTSQFDLLPDIDNEIIFLGNSITARGNWNELFDARCLNRGIGGDDSNRILERIDEIVKRQPYKIFIMIGINDLGRSKSISYIIKNYSSIIKKIKTGSPHSQIYLQSVLPINSKIRDHRRKREEILSLNIHIKKLADDHNIHYVDLYPKFIDAEGQLKQELTTDGIHINGPGYMVWRNALLQYIE